jgi:hypothetical protein
MDLIENWVCRKREFLRVVRGMSAQWNYSTVREPELFRNGQLFGKISPADGRSRFSPEEIEILMAALNAGAELDRYNWIKEIVYEQGALSLTQLASASDDRGETVGGGFCVENGIVLGVADSLEEAIDDARKKK